MAEKRFPIPPSHLMGFVINMTVVILAFALAGQLFGAFNPTPEQLVQTEAKLTVSASEGKIRSEPTTDATVIRDTAIDEELTLLGYDQFFYHVRTQDGTEGYIANWLVDSNSTQLSDLAHLAKLHMPQLEKKIAIDAGHGGEDPGAITDSLYEKDITLSTAAFLQEKFKQAGAEVVMTRTDDTYISLEERTQIANGAQADYFFSIHYDASETEGDSGTTTYFYDEASSLALAETINPQLIEHLPLANNGIRFGDYQVIRDTTMPGLLFELGYMSNQEDVKAFSQSDYHDQAAQAIFDGLFTKFWQAYYPTVPALYQQYANRFIVLLVFVTIGYFSYHYWRYRKLNSAPKSK